MPGTYREELLLEGTLEHPAAKRPSRVLRYMPQGNPMEIIQSHRGKRVLVVLEEVKEAAELYKRLSKLEREEPPFGKVPGDVRRTAVWVDPKLVAEVEFAAWTSDPSKMDGVSGATVTRSSRSPRGTNATSEAKLNRSTSTSVPGSWVRKHRS